MNLENNYLIVMAFNRKILFNTIRKEEFKTLKIKINKGIIQNRIKVINFINLKKSY